MAFNISYLENEIIDQYLYDENPTRPWIIGFSGGKDSTMLLQVVWNALRKLEPILLTRKIYVVCNDTMVENPRIVRFIGTTLKKVQQSANLQNLPIVVEQTIPKLDDTFWVRLIGLGYPAPNKFYRWCTERLKINPTTRLIQERIGEFGEAIILLGTRSDESSARSASMKKHERSGKRLRTHILPNAFVFAPIKDIKTTDLWQYLNQVPPPWGGTHKELVTLYRNANSGDCPLVIDDTTPSCGNSRFGCWVCTVVNKDKSMEGLIDNGEEWMLPLLDIRNFLIHTRDNPELYREKTRRDGKIHEKYWGPCKFETRVEILKRILQAQKEIQDSEGVELITHQELVFIQYHWYRDGYFKTRVTDIFNQYFNKNLNFGKKLKREKEEEDLLKSICTDVPQDVTLLQDLLALQRSRSLMIKKRGLQGDIERRIEYEVEKH